MPVRTRSFLVAAPMTTQSAILASPATPDQHPRPPQVECFSTAPQTPKKRARSTKKTPAVVTPPPVVSSSTLASSLEAPYSNDKGSSGDPKPTKKKKPRRTAIPQPFEPPQDWRETYSLVQELRSDRTAPCDHSGCEALADETTTPQTVRFQILLSLMLSSQTKDAVVGAAIRHMQNDGVANVDSISQMTPETLNSYIAKVGFHNNKTKYILAAVQILQQEYNGDIPNTAEGLMQLPGVGPKMAYICESAAFGTQSGIGVDTHMHRIFPLIGFVKTNLKTPEQTRVQLESWLPREHWGEVNLLFVGFGQEVQQYKTKILQKAMDCSRPSEALALLKRCGLDYDKVGAEMGVTDRLREILNGKAAL